MTFYATLFPSKHTKLIPITSSLYLETSLEVLLCACLLYIKANSLSSKRKHRSLYARRVVQALSIVITYTILVCFMQRGKYQHNSTDHLISTRLYLFQSTLTMLQFHSRKAYKQKGLTKLNSLLTMLKLKNALHSKTEGKSSSISSWKQLHISNTSTHNCMCSFALQQEEINLSI